MKEALDLAQHRERIVAARQSLGALDEVLWQVPSSGGAAGLAALLTEIDSLGGACDAARVTVSAEAMDRGETGGGSAAMTPTQWVRRYAPTTRAGGAGQVVALAVAFGKPVNAAVKQAVDAGRLPVRSAAAVVTEADTLRPLLTEGAEGPVVEGLIDMASHHGPRGCRQLRSALLAKYGRDGLLQREQPPVRATPHDRAPPSPGRASRAGGHG